MMHTVDRLQFYSKNIKNYIAKIQISYSTEQLLDKIYLELKPDMEYCSIVIKPIMLQIIKNQFNYQLVSVCSARTYKNWKRKVKNNKTQSIILVHPSSRATSSLLCPSSKENLLISINCSNTINYTILTPCKNQIPTELNNYSP